MQRVVKFKQAYGNTQNYERVLNKPLAVRLVTNLFAEKIAPELKQIGRKTLDSALVKCQNFVELLLSMKQEGMDAPVYEKVTLDGVLELIKGLDVTEQRAAKMLDATDL